MACNCSGRCNCLIQVQDTSCIDLNISGVGTAVSPYIISALPVISAVTGNQLSCEADGLFASGSGFSGEFARVFNSTDISAPSGTDTILTFDSVRIDSVGFHTLGTGKFTIINDGMYVIDLTVLFDVNANGDRGAQFRLNGTTVIAIQRQRASSAGDTSGVSLTTLYHLIAGDYVEPFVFQTSGGPLDVLSSGNISPEYSIARVG